MNRVARGLALGVGVAAFLAAAAPTAFAYSPPSHPPPTTTPMSDEPTEAPPAEAPAAERDGSALTLAMPSNAELGNDVRIEARLTNDEGVPVADALVSFVAPASWGEEISGDMVLGTARTDADGLATITTTLRRSGAGMITARFAGTDDLEPSNATADVLVTGDAQLYEPSVGVNLPGAGGWLIAAVVALVWLLYFVAARQAYRIARFAPALATAPDSVTSTAASRREFLERVAVPAGVQAAIVAVGAGLVAVVGRSPDTHANLGDAGASRYRRTPISYVGDTAEMREMPEILDREVSFSGEVAPILMARAGPHVMVPEHSPPPNNVRLDAYEHIMGREGLVVPGKPEESMLVTVLLDPAMQMPPGLPALPENEIQLIASWVAQGAMNN